MAEHLIDISGWNDIRDWFAVRADGIVGASIKVTQATNFASAAAPTQVTGARAAGVVPGGYHFGDPRVGALEQARFFAANAAALRLLADDSLAPMYDCENWEAGGLVWSSHEQITDHIGTWLECQRDERGIHRAFVYGSESWWTGGWIRPDDFAVSGVDVLNWIALFNGRPGDTAPWADRRDALHQHTSAGRVPGIAGNVDKNVTLSGRTLAELLINMEGAGVELSTIMTNAWDGKVTVEQVLRAVDQRSASADDRAAKAVELLEQLVPALVDLADRVDSLERSGGATDVQVDDAVQRQFARPDGPLSNFLRADRNYGLVPAPITPPPSGTLSMRGGTEVPAAVADQWATATAEPHWTDGVTGSHAERPADVPDPRSGGAE